MGVAAPFTLEEASSHWRGSVAIMSLMLGICLCLFVQFALDLTYSQPTLKAFLPLVVGYFFQDLFWLLSHGYNLIHAPEWEGPEGILDTGIFCDFGYAAVVCNYMTWSGLAFTAWVPLALVRCAKNFQVLRLSRLNIAGAVLLGGLMGLLYASANYLRQGKTHYRGIHCFPTTWGDPFLSVLTTLGPLLMFCSFIFFFRKANHETAKLGESAHAARLKRKAASMKRFCLLAVLNYVVFTVPFVFTHLARGFLGLPALSRHVMSTVFHLSNSQVGGIALMLWMRARKLRRRQRSVDDFGLLTNFSAQTQQPLDLSLLQNRGVSLHFLHWFVQENEVDKEMTVGQVMHGIVMNETAEEKGSYVEHIMDLQDAEGRPAVAKPSYFVSHCWNDSFLNLLEQLTLFSRNEGVARSKRGSRRGSTGEVGERDTVYFWIDIFAVNQHGGGVVHDLANMGAVIESSKAVLLTLNPWNAPKTLNRVWCLWEVLKAVQCAKTVVPVMRASEERHFVQTMQEDREQVMQVLSTIEVQNASATVPSDKSKIFAEIEETVGFAAMNDLLKVNLHLFLQGIAVDRAVVGLGSDLA